MQPEHDGLELHQEPDPSAPAAADSEPTVEARFTREDTGAAIDPACPPETSAHTISEPAAPQAPHTPLATQLEAIVQSAERAAEEIRIAAEARAQARIAEADRAADYRASAAEEEAAEILAGAHAESERLINEAVLSVDSIYAEAQAKRQEAEQLLEQARTEAKQISEQTVSRARGQARELVADAHDVTDEVLAEGTEMSTNLRDLSDSLRTNAERLLRDIRLAHGSMTARLDQAMPDADPSSRPDRRERSTPSGAYDGDDGLDVPEFFVPED